MTWWNWPAPSYRGSRILGGYVQSLRNAINEALQEAGLAQESWIPPTVGPGDRIEAFHFTQMRSAIQRLWYAGNMGTLPSWTTGSGPAAGRAIYGTDLADLRAWLNEYDVRAPNAHQGVDSKSYDPSDESKPVIQADPLNNNDWPADLINLRSATPLSVRCNVVGPRRPSQPGDPPNPRGSADLTQQDKDRYVEAFNRYRARGIHIFVMLTREFYWPDQPGAPQPDDPLTTIGGVDYTNAYIEGFVARAAPLGQYFFDQTEGWVQDCIIWNEPNEQQAEKYLHPQRFGALLSRCNATMLPDWIYWGGIDFPYQDQGWSEPLSYVESVFQELVTAGKVGENVEYPWRGINVHIHNYRTDQEITALFDEVQLRQRRNGDANELLVGEWGVYPSEQTPSQDAVGNMLRAIQPRATRMFYFSHHTEPLVGPPVWGARYWSVAPDKYVLSAQTTNLYAALQAALVNTS